MEDILSLSYKKQLMYQLMECMSTFSLTPKEYCNCKQSIIYGFDIGEKNI